MNNTMKKYIRGILFFITLTFVTAVNKLGGDYPIPEIIELDPTTVEKKVITRTFLGSKWTLFPRVRGGTWDLNTVGWAEYAGPLYASIRDRYVDDIPWEETTYYQRAVHGISSTNSMYAGRFHSREDVEDHFARLDHIYTEIDNGAYKRAIDVFKQKRSGTGRSLRYLFAKKIAAFNDVTISFDRNGEPMFAGDGTHRLSLAKVSSIDTIPVQVHLRHRHWHDTREAIRTYCTTNGNPHPINHPDIPYDEYDLETNAVLPDLRAAITGDYILEYTDYIFPIFATAVGDDDMAAYVCPSTTRIKKLNAVFESNAQYNFTQVTDQSLPEDENGTTIVTSLGPQSSLSLSDRETDFFTKRVILVRPQSATVDRSPLSAYELTETIDSAGVVCEVFSK